ncbi:MAG TPA: amino acid permease [Chitinophagaceae bacterium]|jgi:APA family basic amino acid/polyamine antiporter|nr:amino acid permease [Chitinophagaceae bacterium]
MSSITSLAKKIGFWSATSIAIGTIIGSGVFMKPASMAAELGSPVWLALVWVIAGIFSLFGALIYAELGAMIPETGGIYAYFKYMFGDFFAFLFGWAAFAVINTASVAAISFICARYADYFLHLPRFDTVTELSCTWHIPFIGDLHPLEDIGVKSLAIVIILLFTFLNYRSVKAGSYFQVLSTFVKVVVICLLVFGIFFSGKGSIANFWQAEDPKHGGDLISAFIVAMTGAFFAYDGWINVNYIAGEIKEPQKNIPRSLVTGVVACIIIYVLVNQAYLYVLPVEQVASSSLVAADAVGIAMGTTGSAIIAALIVLCTLGSINGNTMATCRVTYAMSKDKLFAPWAGREHKRFATPYNALWLHCIWTCVFVLTGSFDMLADMFVFITWIAYGAGAVGIFLLRKRMPDKPRPYKIWGHPVVTILFILFTAFYLITTVYNDVSNYIHHRQPVINSVLGLVITSLGVPLYFYFKRRNVSKE